VRPGSRPHAYTTAPEKGGTDAVTIGFAGDSRDDLGRSDLPVWKAIGGRVKSAGAKMMTFSGDFVLIGTNQDMWESWNKAADAFGGDLFVAMAPGNHENEQVRYYANALMPGKVGKNTERYASFDYGAVHVVMLDDFNGIIYEGGDSTGYKAELLAWLEKDLAAADANRAAVPFIMTFHHHPLFTSGTKTDRVKERAAVRAALQSMFDAHHVDLDIAGHDHFYERSKPIVGDAENAKGTNYIVCAAGGAPSYDTATTALSQKIVHYDPDKREGIYGLVTADKTKLSAKVYKMNGATGTSPADDTLVDELTLTR
jgi:acid phosphatase type 7